MDPILKREEIKVRIAALRSIFSDATMQELLKTPADQLTTTQGNLLQLLYQEIHFVLNAARNNNFIPDAEVNTYIRLLTQTNPPALVLFDERLRSELEVLLRRVDSAIPPEAQATLSPEDRKRIFEAARASLELTKVQTEELRWREKWREEIRAYLRKRLSTLQQEQPEFFAEYELALEGSADAMLITLAHGPTRPIRPLSDAELFKLVTQQLESEIIRLTTVINTNTYERVSFNYRPQALQPKTRRESEQLVRRELEQMQKLVERYRLEIKSEKTAEKLTVQTFRAIVASVAEGTQAVPDIENRTSQSIAVAATIAPIVQARVAPFEFVAETPAAGAPEDQIHTAMEVQRAYKQALQEFQQKINAQGGKIDIWQFNGIKTDLVETLRSLESQGVHPEKIKRLLREAKSLQFSDIPGLIANLGTTQIDHALVTGALTSVVVEYQDKFRKGGLSAQDNIELQRILRALTKDTQLQSVISQSVIRGENYQQVYQLMILRQAELKKANYAHLLGGLGERIEERRRAFTPPAPDKNIAEPDLLGQLPPAVPTEVYRESMMGNAVGGGLNRLFGLGRTPLPPLPRPPLGAASSLLTKIPWWRTPIGLAVLGMTCIVLFLLITVIASDNSAFLPTSNQGTAGGRTPGEHALAAGTCPVPNPDPNFVTDTLQNDPANGHASDAYWNMLRNRLPPERRHEFAKFPIPDQGIYTGCNDTSCQYYGLAIDVDSRDGNRDVVAPYLCDNELGCSDPQMTWTVYKVRGSEVLYLESQGNGRHWKIALIHIQHSASVGSTFTANQPAADGSSQSDKIGTYTTGGGAPHLHFEVVMDERPVDPTPFCDGTAFGGVNPPTGSGPYCAIEDPITQIGTRFGARGNTFSCICNRESNGDPAAINDGCLPAAQRQHNPDQTLDYSIGLFQINLLVHPSHGYLNTVEGAGLKQAIAAIGKEGKTCSDAFDGVHLNCRILDQELLNVCIKWFQDPVNNTLFAQQMSGSGTNLTPWKADEGTCF